jgi:hypothetical protein
MAAVTTAIAVGSLAVAGAGAAISYSAQKKTASAQSAQASAQNKASAKVAKITQQQEKLRKTAMNLEATRQQRTLLRQAQLARANSVNNAANAGSGYGSGLPGAIGSITGQAGAQSTSIFANQQAGNENFDLNAQIAAITGQANTTSAGYQSSIYSSNAQAAFGESLFKLGASGVNNSKTAGDTYTSLFAPAGSNK